MVNAVLYRVRISLVFILLALGFGQGYAQALSSYKHLSVRNGLSNNQVNAILKDSKGVMWIGTASGLNRFDGFSCKSFVNNDDSNSLTDSYITEIHELDNGNLLVCTGAGYVLLQRDNLSFSSVEELTKKWKLPADPNKIIIDQYKNAWCYVQGKGLYQYRPSDNSTYFYPFGKQEHCLPDGEIYCIREVQDGVLLGYSNCKLVWVNALTKNVVEVDEHLQDFYSKGSGYPEFQLLQDRNKNVWVVTTQGLHVYMHNTEKWVDSLESLGLKMEQPISTYENMLKCLTSDDLGNIYIGSDKTGLLKINLDSWSLTASQHKSEDSRSLCSNSVQSIFVADDGMLWVGTYKDGLSYHGPNIFTFQELGFKDIGCIAEYSDNCFWLGGSEGLWKFDKNTNKSEHFTKAQGLSSDVIVSLLQARSGDLWIGTFQGGLMKYANGRFSVYKYKNGDPSSLVNDNIWNIAEDQQGRIWIATLGSGVQCIDPVTGHSLAIYNDKNGLSNNFVSSIFVCRDGNILVGTSYGYDFINVKTGKVQSLFGNVSESRQITNNNVMHAIEDTRGLIWIGTRQGINILDRRKDSLYIFSEPENSIIRNQQISGIAEDKQHDIWLATSNGVVKVQVYKAEDSRGYSFRTIYYDELDGLQGREFNQRSVYCAKDGVVYLGGPGGLNFVNPTSIHTNVANPRVFFSDLLLFNEEIRINKEYNGHVILTKDLEELQTLTLDYSENVITFVLGTDNYNLPEKTSFMYKLDGFNDSWLVSERNQNRITYTNLAPGSYTLRIKTINGNGYVSENERILNLIITPPFWRSTWAYVLYVVLLLAFLLYIRHILLNRQKKQLQEEQQKQMAEKEMELNDMKMRFLTNASHELRTPLSLIISPVSMMLKEETDAKKHDQLAMIDRNANHLLNLVNQLIDATKSNGQNDELMLQSVDIVSYLRNITLSFKVLSEKNIDLNFHSDMKKLVMLFDEDKIGKVVNNLLSNAFKFTPREGKVDLGMTVLPKTTEEETDWLQITVADTGCGISDEDKKHIFERFYQAKNQKYNKVGGSGVGLNLAYEFVMLHGGKLSVADNPEGGSVFTVILPIKKSDVEEEDPLFDETDTAEKTVFESSVRLEDDDIRKYTLLVVDDNADFLDFMDSALSTDYFVVRAIDGLDALEKMKSMLPDLIICDNMMPRMDGNELCRTLKDDRNLSQIPFVMLTARTGDEHRQDSLNCGVDEYLTKPFNMEELNMRIKHLLSMRETVSISGELDVLMKNLTPEDEQFLAKASLYVENNISNTELTVEDFSSAMNMSRVHLYKKITFITGRSPIEFIRMIRLKKAADMIQNTQKAISEIAYSVGFNNPRYFSKYFKDAYGMLPSVYREMKIK